MIRDYIARQSVELIDNINKTLKTDLVEELHSGSRVAIAASCFSIYAFDELKAQLKDIEELRFIFTSPTFVTEKVNKQKREFYIPRLNRERNLCGSEFEIKLRNELSQKAIAKECANWIREKVCFKSNRTGENMMGFATVDDKAYMPITGFTTVELGCERGDNAYTSRIIYVNNIPCIKTRSGDSFEAIAKACGISLRKLLRYNDKNETSIQSGMHVFLGVKKNKAARGYTFHKVKARETMYDIAQLYGIKFYKLLQYNYMEAKDIPQPGELISLRRATKLF